MAYKYTFKDYDKEHMSRAALLFADISYKNTLAVCRMLKNKNLQQAKRILEQVAKRKMPVYYGRYNREIAHKAGIGPGRYPVKIALRVNELLNQVEANAQNKGLNTSQLKIIHISVKRAHIPPHYGRRRGIRMKRAHVEVVVKESFEEEKKEKAGKKKIRKTKN
jgi:large subunit ribosomal protein L22